MRMSCPGKVVSMAVTNDGAYCAASIGDKIYIWQVPEYCIHSTAAYACDAYRFVVDI